MRSPRKRTDPVDMCPSDHNQRRCIECATLLGVHHGACLDLRYKQAQYTVVGGKDTVTAVCPKCGTLNVLSDIPPTALPPMDS